MTTQKSLPRSVLDYVLAILGVFLAGGAFYLSRAYLDDKHDESLLFLPVVIACAVRLGFGPAVVASLLAVVIWDFFFIPPHFALSVGRAGDGIDLVAFLVAAIITSQIAAQARRTALQAELREREIAILYEVGQIVSREIDSDRILHTMAEQIAQTCRTSRCMLFRRPQEGAVLDITANSVGVSSGISQDTEVERAIHDYAVLRVMYPHRQATNETETALPLELVEKRGAGKTGALDPLAGVVVSHGPAAGVYLRLQDGETTVGVLFVGPRNDGQPRNLADTRLVAALGNYAASVLARQQIADESRVRIQNAARFEERNRLAREIHDTLAQGLTGIVIQLQAADGGTAEDHAVALTQAKQLAEECLNEARRSVKALRPSALEGRDLPTALSEMLAQATRATAIHGEFHEGGTPFALPSEIDANLLRIGQEAVTNAIRHSEAREIRISLTYEATDVHLSIEDDGIGIASRRQSGQGYGLIGMRERAAQIGARLEIDSAPGRGSSILVNIPVASARS